MERAWTFYRRSTNLQELSIDDQRRECEAFAATHGMIIQREFVPTRGYASGMNINRDPTFIEMIRLAEAGNHGVRYLLVYDVSRFGRLPAKLKIYYEQHFQRHGIRVISVKDDFRNDGSIGDDITQLVKHSEAHQYSVKLSELTLRGMKSHARLGHSVGGKAPYGYDRLLVDQAGNPVKILRRGEHKADKLQRVIFTPSPSEAPIVREIFETYSNGTGINTIVNDLNARKIAPPRGMHWGKGIIRFLLRNRAYLGERIYNKRSYKGYRRGEKGDLFNPKVEWISTKQAHEPILTEEVFDKVQLRFGSWKARVGGAQRRPYMLSGLCVCGRCGYKLVGQNKRSGKGYRARYYACSGYVRSGPSVCASLHLPSEYLEAVVIQAIRDNLNDPEWKEEIKENLASMIEAEFGTGAETHVEEIKAEIVKVSKEIDNMVGAIRDGAFSPALSTALKDAETRCEDLKLRLREAQRKVGVAISPQGYLSQILGLSSRFEDALQRSATPERKKDLIQGFVCQVNVNREGARMSADCILWKVPKIETAQHPVFGTLDRLTSKAPESSYLSGALRGPVFDPTGKPKLRLIPWLSPMEYDFKRPFVHYKKVSEVR